MQAKQTESTIKLPERNGLKGIVEVSLKQKEKGLCLSITGEVYEWKRPRSGFYTCGQCIDTIRDVWGDIPEVARLCEIWDRWHLNDMRAGCEHQRAMGWKSCNGHYDPTGEETCSSPKQPSSEEDIQKALHEVMKHGVGLVRGPGRSYRCNEDRVGVPCPTCGYKYGHAWLFEEIPAEVIDEIRAIVSALTE